MRTVVEVSGAVVAVVEGVLEDEQAKTTSASAIERFNCFPVLARRRPTAGGCLCQIAWGSIVHESYVAETGAATR